MVKFKFAVSNHIDIVDIITANPLPPTITKTVTINSTHDTATIAFFSNTNSINSLALGTNVLGCLKLQRNALTQLNDIIDIQSNVKEFYITNTFNGAMVDSFKFKMPAAKYIVECIATEKSNNSAQFTLSPNPTTGNLYIRTIDDALLGAPISIYDMLGQKLANTTLQSQNQWFDISTYPAGVYLVRIENTLVKVVKN